MGNVSFNLGMPTGEENGLIVARAMDKDTYFEAVQCSTAIIDCHFHLIFFTLLRDFLPLGVEV